MTSDPIGSHGTRCAMKPTTSADRITQADCLSISALNGSIRIRICWQTWTPKKRRDDAS